MDDSEPVQSNGEFTVFNEERAFQDSMSADLNNISRVSRGPTCQSVNRINIVSISRSGLVNTVIFESLRDRRRHARSDAVDLSLYRLRLCAAGCIFGHRQDKH